MTHIFGGLLRYTAVPLAMLASTIPPLRRAFPIPCLGVRPASDAFWVQWAVLLTVTTCYRLGYASFGGSNRFAGT